MSWIRRRPGGSLFEKLSRTGAALCVKTLAAIEAGTAVYTPQDPSQATKVGLIHKQFGLIDWKKPAREIECLIRGLNPWPSAYTKLHGKTLKIWDADVADGDSQKEAGAVAEVTRDAVFVQTGEGLLKLKEVQLEGKRRMACDAFLRGYSLKDTDQLGE